MTAPMLVSYVLLFAAAADRPAALFQQAEQLSRSNHKAEALAKVEEAVAEIERAVAAGEELSWQARNGLRFAARLAREDFLDYEKSLAFCHKLFALADTDYWRVPARLERALTFRAQREFDKAQREYEAIAAADPRQRATAILPRAEMVYFEIGDQPRGQALILEGLRNPDIPARERFAALRKCAEQALSRGDREAAYRWYAQLEELPFEKTDERARFLCQAWYEMGRIQESRGRTAEAKTHYRRAMELDQGEMRFRTRARDALESLEYFD